MQKKKAIDQTKIKNKTVKKKVKSSDTPVTVASETKNSVQIPNLNTLRQDALLQLKVEQRLKELQENDKPGKVKSLRCGSVEVMVQNKVKWSHEYVLSGSSKECISYDQLSVIQWVAGFCRIMKEEKNSDSKDFMLDYLVSLLDNAQDFSSEATKASHTVLLCQMEQGEIANFSQVEKIDRIRRANAQRHIHPSSTSHTNRKGYQKHRKQCHASTLIKVLVPTTKAMTPEVLDITMFAVLVFPMVKLSHMLRLIAKISLQKYLEQKNEQM